MWLFLVFICEVARAGAEHRTSNLLSRPGFRKSHTKNQQAKAISRSTKKLTLGEEVVPRIVHFVLTDRGTSFFDWTAYTAVMAARTHVTAKVVFEIHALVASSTNMASMAFLLNLDLTHTFMLYRVVPYTCIFLMGSNR
jgi:hypothetical protein